MLPPIQPERAQRRSIGCNYHQSKKWLKDSIWLLVAQKRSWIFERRYSSHSVQLLSKKSRKNADSCFNSTLSELERWRELVLRIIWETASFRAFRIPTDIFSFVLHFSTLLFQYQSPYNLVNRSRWNKTSKRSVWLK